MKRRTVAQWDRLSPRTRARYLKAGVDQELYLSGVPLKAARGHSKTPESPSEAESRPDNFRGWLLKRWMSRSPSTAGVVVLTREQGLVAVYGLSERERSVIGKHWNAINKALGEYGDTTALRGLEGTTVGGFTKPDPKSTVYTFTLETSVMHILAAYGSKPQEFLANGGINHSIYVPLKAS